MVARPATLGACQVRLQLSMLLLPTTTRANFWVMKFSSLVAFEQLKSPNAVGPWASIAAWKVAPVECLVHVVGRSWPVRRSRRAQRLRADVDLAMHAPFDARCGWTPSVGGARYRRAASGIGADQ
jgi:hypothetical protein